MTQSAACKKVISLLALYIDNKLDKSSTTFVKNHLDICPNCYRRYISLKELINELRTTYKTIEEDTVTEEKNRTFNIKEYEKFQSNLSAYFDNELSLNESLDTKKYMIKFPNSRTALEEMYLLRKIINNSYNEVKKSFNADYSKSICKKILGQNPYKINELILKIASFTGIILLFGMLIGANISFAQMVKEKSLKLIKKTIYVNSQINHELASDLMQQN